MKFHLKQLFETPMFIVFLAMIVLFSFGSIGELAEVNRYAVVTAVGIDFSENEDEFEVSLLTFVPVAEQNFAENYKMISSKGKSVSEAIDYAGLHIGREVGLSHVKILVLNEELLSDDLYDFLDYLARNNQLSTSTKLVVTNSSAKDFLSTAQQLESENTIKVSELVTYNQNYIYGTDSSIETFLQGTYGPTKVGLIAYLTVDDGDEGVTASLVESQSGSGEGEEESSSSQTKEILNDGETVVFKDAKEVVKLTGDEVEKINLIKGNYHTGALDIENVTDENFNNATLTFEIFGNKVNYKVKYENSIPVFYIDASLILRLSEVRNNGNEKMNIDFAVLSKETTNTIVKEIKKYIAEGIQIMRDNKVDIADFYTTLYNSNKKSFLSFLDNLEDPEDYLNHIVFKVTVNIYSK